MSNYLVSISYDGSFFYGWASQPKVFTVQGFIEERLKSIFSVKVPIFGSSRTDRGVHAIDQKFTFSLKFSSIDSFRMKKLLSKLLRKFIVVNNVWEVEKNFTLSKRIKLKEYKYFLTTKNFQIFQTNYFLDLSREKVNIEKLKKNLKIFEGDHDFFNFSCVKLSERLTKNTLRKINEINFSEISSDLISISFISKGFLRHQIRAIMGECIEKSSVFNGEEILKKMLSCKKVDKYKKISSSSGLYLWKTYLENDKKYD